MCPQENAPIDPWRTWSLTMNLPQGHGLKKCWQGPGYAKEFVHAKIHDHPICCGLCFGFFAVRCLKKIERYRPTDSVVGFLMFPMQHDVVKIR